MDLDEKPQAIFRWNDIYEWLNLSGLLALGRRKYSTEF